MKKVLVILSIFLILLFVPKVNAKDEDIYEEKLYEIRFDSLNSKKINELFKDTNGFVIEIDISIGLINKVYRINTKMSNNLEEELTKKVVEYLENENLNELAVEANIKGFKVNRIKLRCIKKEYEIIKERSKNV